VRVEANPKYRQLKEILKEQINEGKLKPGDRIPAEERIAEKYEVSLGTVRQAMAGLVNEDTTDIGCLVKKLIKNDCHA